MTKSQIRVKQVCLLGVISNVKNNKNELLKTVKLTSFQKPQLQSASIFFKLVHLYLLSFVCAVLVIVVIPCFHVLSGYLYVSLNLVAVVAV